MKENKSAYSCMFLVPKEIYEKLVQVIDERDNLQLEKLNRFAVGNTDGAFPNLPPGPGGGGPDHPDSDSDPQQPGPGSPGGSIPPPQPFNYYSSGDDDDDDSPPDSFRLSPELPSGDRSNARHNNVNEGPSGANNQPTGSANKKRFRFLCDMCGASFQNNRDLKSHKRAHFQQMGNAIIYGNNLPLPVTSDSVPDHRSSPQAMLSQHARNSVNDLRSNPRAMMGQHVPALNVAGGNPRSNNITRELQNIDADDEMSDSEPESNSSPGNCPLCLKAFKDVKSLNRHFFYCRKDKSLKKIAYSRKNTVPGRIVTSSDRKSKKQFESWHAYKKKNSIAKIPQADVVSDIESISTDEGSDSDSDIAALQCSLCSFVFSKKKALERHMLNVHDVEKDGAYTKPKGEKRDVSAAKLKNYNPKKVLRTLKSNKCQLCNLVLKNKEQLNRHLLKSHQNQQKALAGNSLFTCKLCNHIFSKQNSLNRHLLNIHSCTPDYKNLNVKGVKRKNKDSSLPCSWCDEKFKVLFDLEKHVKEKHPDVKKSVDGKYRSWV